jgi:hypothetical protein
MRSRIVFLVVGVLAGIEVFHYLDALNTLASPVASIQIAPPPTPARKNAPARRVVWVLIDGLRLDASRTMPTLNRLRQEGADFEASADFPTYSIPNYVVQACGLDPATSGVRTNGYSMPVTFDSVFQRAREAGLATGAIGTDTPWFQKYFGSWISDGRILVEPDGPPAGALALVHLDYTDHEAHQHGSESAEYRAAVAHADAVLGKIVAKLDPAHDALVVTADHGHIARGGHGGAEPEVVAVPVVLWGAGISRGIHRTGISARDVAPTMAALLGLPALAHARGISLLGDDAGARIARDRVEKAVAADAKLRPARVARASAIAAVPAVAVLAALLIVAVHARPGLRGWLTSPIYLVMLAGLYLMTDRLSFSSANEHELFMVRFAALASVAAIVQLMVGGRRSAAPAAVVALMPVFYAVWLAPERPVIDLPTPGLAFFPVLAFGALCNICGWALFWARVTPPDSPTAPR